MAYARRVSLRHWPLGPLLWARADEAEAKPSLERTMWEEGLADAAAAFGGVRSPAGAAQAAVAPVGGGLAAGLSTLPLGAQIIVFAVVGLTAYWTVPTVWACVGALCAPGNQRDEARDALREETNRCRGLEAALREQSRQLHKSIRDREARAELYRLLHFAETQLGPAIEMMAAPPPGDPGHPQHSGLVKPTMIMISVWLDEVIPLLVEIGQADRAAALKDPVHMTMPDLKDRLRAQHKTRVTILGHALEV